MGSGKGTVPLFAELLKFLCKNNAFSCILFTRFKMHAVNRGRPLLNPPLVGEGFSVPSLLGNMGRAVRSRSGPRPNMNLVLVERCQTAPKAPNS